MLSARALSIYDSLWHFFDKLIALVSLDSALHPEKYYNETREVILESPEVCGRTNLMPTIFQSFQGLRLFFRTMPFLLATAKEEGRGSIYGEKYLRRLLWYLFAGTRGGPSRAGIIKTLQSRPCNANQLAHALSVDYKTIQHHVRILEENGLIVPSEKGTYGAVLFLSPKMEEALPILDEIWSKIGRSKISAANTERRD